MRHGRAAVRHGRPTLGSVEVACRTWLDAVRRGEHVGAVTFAGGATVGEFRRVPRHRRASSVFVSLTGGVS